MNRTHQIYKARTEGHYTYPYSSYKQVGLFFSHRKIGRYGEVKLRVIIIDISNNYVHSSCGCLKEKQSNREHNKTNVIHFTVSVPFS